MAQPVLRLSRQNTNALRLAYAARARGQWVRATRHYLRALRRWLALTREERRPRAIPVANDDAGAASGAIADELAPEIAPEFYVAPALSGERIDILQIGRAQRASRWGNLPLLRGAEAIRAKVTSSLPLAALSIRIDGRVIRRVSTTVDAIENGSPPPPYVYLFNEWIDFRGLPSGFHQLQLLLEGRGIGFLSHEQLICIDPWDEADGDCQDSGSVRLDPDASGQIEQQINTLPSVVHAARRSFVPDRLQRILVVRADQLGDFVLSIPALYRLRELLPEAEFVALVSPMNRGLAESLAFFSAVITADLYYDPTHKRRFLTLAKQHELRRRLHEFAFDLAIDLCPGEDSRPLLRLSGARFTVGFGAHQFPWMSLGIDITTRNRVSGKEQAPHALRVATFVEALGAMLRHEPIVLPLPSDFGILEANGLERGRYIVLHTGARHAPQRWPLAYYTDLARLLLQETALKLVLFVDSPDDAESVGRAHFPPHRCTVLAGGREAQEFDALISHCAVFVGNDSGPKHLAALRGAKVVSIHSGRIAWGEWGQEGDGLIITRHVPCYGCGIEEPVECGKGLACLTHIRPAEVFAAVQNLLDAGRVPDATAAAANSAPTAFSIGRGK
jgi:ADP-heptose:LPS heptosyltransferase